MPDEIITLIVSYSTARVAATETERSALCLDIADSRMMVSTPAARRCCVTVYVFLSFNPVIVLFMIIVIMICSTT